MVEGYFFKFTYTVFLLNQGGCLCGTHHAICFGPSYATLPPPTIPLSSSPLQFTECTQHYDSDSFHSIKSQKQQGIGMYPYSFLKSTFLWACIQNFLLYFTFSLGMRVCLKKDKIDVKESKKKL